MENNEWREVRKDVNRSGRFLVLWIIVGVVVAGAIGVAIWGFNVGTSGVKGQGDAVIQKNSAENWVAAQAGFEADYQDILSSDLKIVNAYQALQATPDDKTAQTNYNGLKSYCLSVVAKYNADARSYLSEDFRAADLPSEIDTNNSTTDCKE
jgi:cytoskeletal protein RodZ